MALCKCRQGRQEMERGPVFYFNAMYRIPDSSMFQLVIYIFIIFQAISSLDKLCLTQLSIILTRSIWVSQTEEQDVFIRVIGSKILHQHFFRVMKSWSGKFCTVRLHNLTAKTGKNSKLRYKLNRIGI